MIETIAVERVWDNNQRELCLHAVRGPDYPPSHYDPFWSVNIGPNDEKRVEGEDGYSNWINNDYDEIRGQAHFATDVLDDICVHALEPLADCMGTAITTFHSYWHDRSVSAANALIKLWLVSSQDSPMDELAAAYDTCLKITIHGFAPFDSQARNLYRQIFLHQLSLDYHRLPKAWLESAARAIRQGSEVSWNERHEGQALLRMAQQTLPALMASQGNGDEDLTS